MLRQHAHVQVRRTSLLAALVALIALATVFWGSAPDTASAGPAETVVLDWNTHAVNALGNAPTAATFPGAGQPPPVAVQHLAMVQGAVYDAVNMIEGGYEPYLAGLPPAPASASKTAAVATAAHDVLVGLGGGLVPPLPAATITWLNTAYALEGIPANDPGAAAGAAAARAMLAERANDGRYGPFRFKCGEGAGEWRPATSTLCTTPSGPSDPFAWVARVEPFLLESGSQLRTKGPHALTSGAYTKEYNEVKELGGGGTTPTLRTPEQTALAQFYIVNPVELFNRTFRTIADGEGLTLVEEARLFAMLNLAGADGLISCWNDKAYWSFWRPITAIQLGDDDGNPRTVGAPSWTPYINTLVATGTPPYPDHPSGYNCVTSSFMHTAEVFFGKKKMPFTVHKTTNPATDVTRSYERFTDVVDDTIDARIYLGIHFRAPDVQGAGIGKDVAHWLDKHYFQPVK